MKFYQIQFTDLIKKLNPKRNLRVHELPYFRKKATAERYLTELFGSSILDRLTSNIILIEVNKSWY